MERPANFVCVWVGDRYSRDYVEIWANMVLRNSSNIDRALWAVTDRPDELPEGIAAIPADPSIPPSYWAKLQLFSEAMPWEVGDRIVYLDLDVCVTGRLEDLVERKGIPRDHGWPTYNSSVMVWDHGEHRGAWTLFSPEVAMSRAGLIVPPECLPAGVPNGGDQEWLTEIGGWDYLPDTWVVSYRWQAKAWPPNGAKVVQFHGEPKPHEVTEGWVPNVWKVGGFTSLPVMNGVNVTHEQILDNVRSSVLRPLPWFSGFGPHKGRAVIVGGAPSLKDCFVDIRAQKRTGAKVIALNNAWRALVDQGVTPDILVLLDARRENVEFIRDLPVGVKCFVASQCHPDVFDALAGHEVVVWHNGFGTNEGLKEILAPWWEEGPNQRPCVLVPGGGTVGLRALWLCAFSGYRTIHLYGCDSSYADDGKHHAYAQSLNDGERIIEVAMVSGGKERRYRCAPWMARQVEEFRESWADLKREGVTIHVHGAGLLPDVARALRDEERAAMGLAR